LFDNWINHNPEGKLKLIEGQLIVGNSLVGSWLLLRQILQGWRADAACNVKRGTGSGVDRYLVISTKKSTSLAW
jgi:hypothetical protein